MNLNVCVIILSIFFSSLSIAGDNSNSNENQFTLSKSNKYLTYISESLDSFRNLTELSSSEHNEKVGNTSWDIQHIGFDNWVNNIQGTLLTQELENAKLSLKLINKKTDLSAYNDALIRVTTAQENLSKFVNTLVIME